MASIKFENVKKTYEDGITVIENLNLEIKDKEFVILVGPSGCGKSTTLRMIAGLEDISGGNLYIGDKIVNDVSPKDRDIAMVFQSYALYPHMTVYKNMAFGLKLRKVDKKIIDEKVRQCAEILDIEKYLNRKPRALSGGQRQRVALGRAMVRDPQVFLLDEPLSNLDAKLRTEMRSQISALHKRLNATFVYVTHDQTEAMTMADRIVVMKNGRIMQADTPYMLYNHPQNIFTAGFIGSPRMNFIPCAVQRHSMGTSLVFGENVIKLNQKQSNLLSGYDGKEAVLGIRPKDIKTDNGFFSKEACNNIKLTVDNCEMMGAEMNIYSEISGSKIIANIKGVSEIEDGTVLNVYFDMNKLHIFDKETEELICD